MAKPPTRIRVTEVVAFFTHPVQVNQRKDPMLEALARATARCRKQFSRITIADLVKLSVDETFQEPGSTKSLKVRSRL